MLYIFFCSISNLKCMAGLKLDDVKVVWVLLKKNIFTFWNIDNNETKYYS